MSQTPPRIAVLPSHMKLGFKPGAIALTDLEWPLGMPEGSAGKTLRDLTPDDHLIVFPKDTLHVRMGFGTRAKVSVLVMEPSVIHGKHMQMLKWSYRRFHKVLSCNEDLLGAIPNGVFFAHGSTWVPEWRDLDLKKTRMMSLIASAKRSQEGHQLRHDVADWARERALDVDVMGSGYRRFGAKAEGLAPYRYSIVIENVREKNYFTEKLVDAVLCRTVPIYWGCPNIGDFMDTGGMIVCNSAAEIHAAVQNTSPEDYMSRLSALDAARQRADFWGDYLKRAAVAVRDAV